jgi:hypothetical protein
LRLSTRAAVVAKPQAGLLEDEDYRNGASDQDPKEETDECCQIAILVDLEWLSATERNYPKNKFTSHSACTHKQGFEYDFEYGLNHAGPEFF